jgi:hypothetical protein
LKKQIDDLLFHFLTVFNFVNSVTTVRIVKKPSVRYTQGAQKMSEDRKLILKMLQENRITIEEAERLLKATEDKAPGASQRASRSSEDTLFDRTAPKVEHFVNSLSSMFDTVSQQLGPTLEKRFEGWFQQKQHKTGQTEAADNTGFETLRRDEQVIPLEANVEKIKLHYTLGDVTVISHAGENIHAALEKRVYSNQVEDKLKYEDLRLESHQEGNTLFLKLAGVEGLTPSKQAEVHLHLQVPASLDLELATDAHDISLSQWSHTQGQVHLLSGSGNLSLQNVALKAIELETRSGNVNAEQASESLKVTTQSGDITLAGSVYKGQLKSASGHVSVSASILDRLNAEGSSSDMQIQVLDGQGSLELSTRSGDIELSGELHKESVLNSASGDLQCDIIVHPAASVSLTTHSGDIDLILRPESQCSVELEARTGDIESRLELADPQTAEHSLKGKKGSGEGVLKAQTQSGDILLS